MFLESLIQGAWLYDLLQRCPTILHVQLVILRVLQEPTRSVKGMPTESFASRLAPLATKSAKTAPLPESHA